ncbi:hypothetical protein WJX81_004689 [Elliptochloris bilobata]|uniref:Deoxyhypusine monooxygenase n=1 Tax=Elliptochloris bilobata TaxID=381761 RepID=A0AAW1QWP5_9CHLO
MALAPAPPALVAALLAKLLDQATSLPHKYRILFSLRSVQGAHAQAALLHGLEDKSALFRHEVAYCLGQRQDPEAVSVLTALLRNEAEHPMVRHEAGEALGAIGTRECLAALAAATADPCAAVAQTCQLALQRIQHYTADVEPVAALGDAFAGGSALLKHEVAYVLGQMQDAAAVDTLRRVLMDASEDAMVRHEAAEALGAIGDERAVELLTSHAADSEPIVADSCVVALDMLEHERSGAFQLQGSQR